MTGFESKSGRWNDRDKAKDIAGRAGTRLVHYMKAHGFSEREMCAAAEISKTTWRRATGRPYRNDEPGSSLLSLRDFIAAAMEMNLDPADVLREATVSIVGRP